jgi:DNA repair protein RecO (recombination protein O)
MMSLGSRQRHASLPVPSEKAVGLVIRAVDFSETSRIVTLWTRELGKVAALAKGGRRRKSAFESGLDLLTVYSIVLLRKSSGGLDLMTEAQATERFSRLRTNLEALHAGYYVAELLDLFTEVGDAHPLLFDQALQALRDFGSSEVATAERVMRFEVAMLHELGYAPLVHECASCHGAVAGTAPLDFSLFAGGVVCGTCRDRARGRIRMTPEGLTGLRNMMDGIGRPLPPAVRGELRNLMNQRICHLLGKRPRTLAFLRT